MNLSITFRSLKKIEFKSVKKYWDMITCFSEQLFCHGVRNENLLNIPPTLHLGYRFLKNCSTTMFKPKGGGA
jgi:hypothetical protein